ncbi:YaaH protein [Salmonella enterica subsp. enterica]|nr:YaaH protein [Salmonella enterica subsp. enterica]
MGNTKLANPAPLGLMGFGMTTILLNLHNAGFFALDGIILAMGIFYGGIAQIFAGLLEYKKRQYLWFNGLYLLRFVLADAGRYPADAENGPDGCA